MATRPTTTTRTRSRPLSRARAPLYETVASRARQFGDPAVRPADPRFACDDEVGVDGDAGTDSR